MRLLGPVDGGLGKVDNCQLPQLPTFLQPLRRTRSHYLIGPVLIIATLPADCVVFIFSLYTQDLTDPRSLKYEDVYLKNYATVLALSLGLEQYFDFYNYRRLHQALNYQTPAQYYGLLTQSLG